VEIVLVDIASEASELADDVGLRHVDAFGCRRSWTDFDETAHVFECAGTIEAICGTER